MSVRSLLPIGLLVAGCALSSQPATTSSPSLPASGPTSPPPSSAPTPTTALTASPTAAATPSATETSGTNLKFSLFKSGFGALTFAANAGDGSHRLFAVEQAGKIKVIDADGNVADQPFLDISSRVSCCDERGLLGLAFHPNFGDNGRFYIDYTDPDGNTVVSEFTVDDSGLADPESERILFTVIQPFDNHNGGMVAFGPDGKLYVGMGDGGYGGDPYGNGQDDHTLLGKIVQVDVDATGNKAKPTIWDKGMRNPWRFSFDRETGDLWIGDVGQELHEEIDAEPAGSGGRNYGWNITEGLACYEPATDCDKTGLTPPVAAYDHGTSNCTVIGGYVYRGSAFPSLVGTYLYTDFCSGTVWALDAAAALAGENPEPVRVGNGGTENSAFAEDEDGELYLVSLGGRLVSIGL